MAVNLSPVGGVAAQFFDNSGQVLTGGLIYTYSAGTTTPATTYTTSSGLTAQPNPIVLNASGRVPDSGEIWLSDGLLYKFALKDQYGVQIATYDNISGINSNFVAYTSQSEVQTATQGQTVFTLVDIQYVPATNNLAVYVNGSKQIDPTNYVETDSTTVTFVSGLNVGDVVQFSTATPVASNVVSAANVSYNEGSAGAVGTNVQAKLRQTVSVKDFGATGDGTTDDTVAIQAALNTGKNIYFPAGIYMHQGGIVQDAQGQHIYGDGIQLLPQPTYPVGNASILRKISGSATGWELSSHNGGAHNISFDNAGYAGNALKISGNYLFVENICMSNVGGTDYAMLLESVNTSYFNYINFGSTNYSCIGTSGADPCLYTEFHSVIIGDVTSATYGMNLSGCNNVSFYNLLCETPIYIGDNTQNLNFYSFASESYTNTSVPLITIEGSASSSVAPTNINIYSARLILGAARSAEVIKVKNAKNVNIQNIQWTDVVSANPIFTTLYTVKGFSLQNLTCYVNATSDAVKSDNTGSFSQNIVVNNIIQPDSAQNIYLRFLAAINLNVLNTTTYVTFYGGFAGSKFLLENVSGTIDTTNIPTTVYVQCTNCTSVSDVAEVATLSNCLLSNGLFVQSGKTRQTTLTLTAAATASWTGVVTGDELIKSVHTLNKTAITGAAGFTGYSVGYTSAGGTNATAWGSNLSPSNGASNGIYDYAVTSPIYGPDNANRDVILTAVGGNFATGSIKLCMIYEKFNVMTS